jgi:transposase
VEHRLPQEELVCPECGGEMTIIGKEALVVRPAEAFLRRDIYYTYARHRKLRIYSGKLIISSSDSTAY